MVQSDLLDLEGLWAHRVLLVLLVREALQASVVKLVSQGHKARKEYLGKMVSTASDVYFTYVVCRAARARMCLYSG